jgi:hypothetical protein
MKPLRIAIAFALVTTFPLLAAPALSVEQAATLAQQHLKERGFGGSRYISSLALEKGSVTQGDRYWYARWSESVKLEEKQTELGIRINMDGTVVRVVEGPPAQPKNYRTRSDRPSILDLK